MILASRGEPMTDWNKTFMDLPPDELDKLAVLRVMECTNGIIQFMYRDKDANALSVEDTRKAMNFSMGSIKRMQIELEDETIDFADNTKEIMGRVRDLYIRGMKQNDDEAYAEFLVASLACMNACTISRLEEAKDKLFDNCYELPAYSWQWGLDYCRAFMRAT
tara:strand:- start:5 stop:493 length:489 start_codon:yes stop_codon:yes gene_type:complete